VAEVASRLGHGRRLAMAITWAPAVVERLRGWHEHGLVEIQWLTTWGDDANDELRQLLGLPRFAVAGTYTEFDLEGATADIEADAHAAVALSAPDPLSGYWWKYDVVRRVLDEHPGRPVIWADDELHHEFGPFRRWAQEHPDLLPVGPDPLRGLVLDDLDRIQTFIQTMTTKRSSCA
jgi:hypothetical protein